MLIKAQISAKINRINRKTNNPIEMLNPETVAEMNDFKPWINVLL